MNTRLQHRLERQVREARKRNLALRALRPLRSMLLALVAATSVVSGFSRTVIAQQPPPPAAQTPRFSATVEVTSLDVSVVDNQGKPIADLTPADFVVRIDNQPRKVMTAEWVPLVTPGSATPVAAAPEGYSTNEGSTNGRHPAVANARLERAACPNGDPSTTRSPNRPEERF